MGWLNQALNKLALESVKYKLPSAAGNYVRRMGRKVLVAAF